MKVTGNNQNSMPSVAQAATSQANEAAKSAKTAGLEKALEGAKTKSSADLGSSSRVELSPRAQDIKKAKELATPSGDIDEAKVARLQAMIDKGQYKINAEAIADRLLDEHTKMPG